MQCGGEQTQQDGQSVLRFVQSGLERGQGGQRLLQIAARLFHFQNGDHARLLAPFGDLQGLALCRQIVARDLQPRLIAAQLHIVERHLGGERDLRAVQVGLCDAGIGLRCFVRTAQAAEHVDFPGGVESGIEQRAAGTGTGGGAALAAAGRERSVQLRQQIGICQIKARACLGQSGTCTA